MARSDLVGTFWKDRRGDRYEVVLIPSNGKLALLTERTSTLDVFNVWEQQMLDIIERDGLTRLR